MFIFLTGYLNPFSSKRRVLLLNYTGFERHLGCQAASNAILMLIKNKIGRVFPMPVIFSPAAIKLLPELDNVDSLGAAYIEKKKILKFFFSTCDYVVINGEGSIYEYKDWSKGARPLELLLEGYIAKKFYKKIVFIVNHSFYSLPKAGAGTFTSYARRIYQEMDYVAAREPRSYGYLRELSVQRLAQSADAAFLARTSDKSKAHKILEDMGISPGFVALFLRMGISCVRIENILAIIRMINDEFKKTIVLFPCSDQEAYFCSRIAENKGLKITLIRHSPAEFISALSLADCVLSGRFHFCIFSALATTPFIAFKSNTPRIEGLLEQLEYPISPADFSDSSKDEILDKVRYAFENKTKLSALLASKLPYLRELAMRNMP
jgi:polysaccharide pyruvyl transferase WcaK-like protein